MKTRLKASRINSGTSLAPRILWTLATLILSGFSALFAPELYESALLASVGGHVVKLMSETSQGAGATGFLVNTPKGVKILTNAHVCTLATKEGNILAYMENGYIEEVHRVAFEPHGWDLCLLSAPEGYDGLDLAGTPPVPGDKVFAVGHPSLEGTQVMAGLITSRTITIIQDLVVGSDMSKCKGSDRWIIKPKSGPKMCLSKQRSYETTMMVAPGASGSPVVNRMGDVVAVVFAYNASDLHGILIPYFEVKDFVNSN